MLKRYVFLCSKKKVEPNIEVRTVEECLKKVFFSDKEMEIINVNDEGEHQKRIFSELKGVKEVQKRAFLSWMEVKIQESREKQYTIPRLGSRHHTQVDRRSGNLYREFEKQANIQILCPGL
jgi:hypothetical protein